MTEQPASAEAMKLARRHADGEVKKCAADIDALIAQRVSAETERCAQIADKSDTEEVAYQAGVSDTLVRLQEPDEELQDALAEDFDAVFLPAWRACAEKHGRHNVHPAWATWGPQFLARIAEMLK